MLLAPAFPSENSATCLDPPLPSKRATPGELTHKDTRGRDGLIQLFEMEAWTDRDSFLLVGNVDLLHCTPRAWRL